MFSFNRATSLKWDEIDHPTFAKLLLTEWIPESDMSDQEKVENPTFHCAKGYLKTYAMEEAWANYWRDSDEEEKQRVLNLPNFDADIFLEITGIDVREGESKSEETIELNGKRYRLIEDE